MGDLTLVSYKTIREKKEREREREKRERGREREFSFHICRYKIEMITSHESLF